MDCPICGSDDIEIINSKQKTTKKKLTEEYLLKCEECGHVYRNVISLKKPRPYRLIISEQDKSHKTTIEFSNDGIKAAAATTEGGIGAAGCGFDYIYKVPVENIDITFNKPYLFLVRDKDTGEVWFTGTVYEPIKG